MIYTRDAHTNDEAWILEKLSKERYEPDSFRPEDFMVAVCEETEERLAFGRLEYHRNVDETEYVEINSVKILDRATEEQARLMLVDLARRVEESGKQQVFTFPYLNQEDFLSVGFEEISKDKMPEVMKERFEKLQEEENDVLSLNAQPKNIEYTVPDEDEEFTKPEGTTDEEVKTIKEELDISDNATTKYSI